jgi:hypothetical protein
LKHLVESLGVPHTEIGGWQVNGQAALASYQARDGDRVVVLAHTVSTAPEGELRFLLDNHLGRLAAYLRMLGLDASYRNDYQDEELAGIASQEGRILLTRDRRLLMRRTVAQGYCPASLDPQEQAVEVVRRFGLEHQLLPFRRCLRCNGLLEPVSKAAVLHRLQPLTKQYYDEFAICPSCDQVYWKGSHYEHMQALIARILGKDQI